MEICIYVHSLAGGGVERVAAILAAELSRREHQITLLLDHDSRENQSYLDSHVKINVLPGQSHFGRLLALADHFARVPYDLVHTVTPALTLVTLVARGLSRKQFRVVGAYHGSFRPSQGVLGRLSFLLTPILTRATDGTVCVSNWMKENLERKWYAKPERLVTIYNPVFIGKGNSSLPNGMPDGDYVLYVSRLIAVKNPLLAIDSFALLPEKYSNCKLVILGDGPYQSKMRTRTEELEMTDRVKFIGYVSDPWDFYREAKVVIVTSNVESFGLVIVEALGHGVPVVAVDSGASRELLLNGKYGILVPPGDPKALASALATALDKPPPAEFLRARAAEFDVDVALDAYERLFQQVMSRGGEPG